MSELKLITTEELKAKLDSKEYLNFWNVLTDEYYNGELIPGSIRVSLDVVGKTAKSLEIPKDKEIIVYCAGSSCPQSKTAQEKLNALGYTNVHTYEGGIEEWQKAGYAIEKQFAETA